MKKILFLFVFLIPFLGLYSQNINPGDNIIFRTDEIAIVKITMDEADFNFMIHDDNIYSDEYLPAHFYFKNSSIDTTLIKDVGIRLRGNTSRAHPKKSYKIKFKEYEGEKFYDLKKFNLKAENNDPSRIRELMSLRTFRMANAPAARSHPVDVYINETYMGQYTNVEQIDDEFVESRFDNDEGNLYKCLWPATLEDDGQIYNNDTYELKTNEEENDRSILANFINVLNHSSSDVFETAIEEVFNVDGFLKYLAAEALLGHWDGYSINKNNYYLYESSTGKIEFIVYDVDNTFGMDWIGGDWGTHDVLDWVNKDEARPLTTKILAREKYMDQYILNLEELLENVFTEEYYFPEFDKLKTLVAESVENDTYFPLTFGFTYSDFENSFTQQVADHAPYGMKDYVTTRISYAKQQLGLTGIRNEIPVSFSMYPNPSNGRSLLLNSAKEIENLRIMDAIGREVSYRMTEIGSGKYQVNFQLKSGIYIIHIDGASRKFVVK